VTTADAQTRLPLGRSLAAGLGAGGIAAIVAALVSLGLKSPDRVFLNSASVSIVVLLGGLITGFAYFSGAGRAQAVRNVAIWIVAAFLIVVAAVLAVEAESGHLFVHLVSFCVPLAAIALIVTGVLTPIMVRPALRPSWVAPFVTVAALAVGVALAGHGAGAERLALPSAGGSSGSGAVLTPQDVAGKQYVIDPSQSKATYTVNEQLTTLTAPDDAIGTTSNVSGAIFLDGRPSTVSVNVGTFKSDDPGRDRHIDTQPPNLNNYPPAQFTVAQLLLPKSYKAGDTITEQVQGMMEVNNVTKPMTFSVQARLDNDTLLVHGAIDFTFEDFNITKPTFSQVVSLQDKIHAEVLLVAKPQS